MQADFSENASLREENKHLNAERQSTFDRNQRTVRHLKTNVANHWLIFFKMQNSVVPSIRPVGSHQTETCARAKDVQNHGKEEETRKVAVDSTEGLFYSACRWTGSFFSCFNFLIDLRKKSV